MSMQKCLMLSVRADYGGGPEHMLSLLRGLADKREFVVAAPLGQAYSDKFAQYATVHDIPFRRFSLSSLFALARLVRRERIGLIHSHGKGAGIYGRLLGWMTGRPVVHTFHGFHYRHLPALKRHVYLGIERFLARRTAVLVNVSPSEQGACADAGVMKPGGSVVVPNGVNVPDKRCSLSDRAVDAPWILINVARHEREKGVDGVLAVAKALADQGVNFELWLVGDGEHSGELRQQAQADGIDERVYFLGFRGDVPALLQKADIFISASHGEGMPLTLLEAMAAGVPVVASDVIGNRDVVEPEQTGLLFPLHAPEEGADAVARLVRDRALYESCSETGHRRARERYSVEAMCERINLVYGQAVAKKHYR